MELMRRFRRGAAAVEFAMLVPVFAMVAVATAELSSFMSQRFLVQRAAMDGARLGATTLEGSLGDGSLIEAAAESQARGLLAHAGRPCVEGECSVTAAYVEIQGLYWVSVDVVLRADVVPSGFGLTPEFVTANMVMLAQQQ